MPSKVGVDSNVKDITGHEDNEKRDSEVDANGMESEMNVSDNGGVKDKFPNSEESLKRDGDREPLETTKLATDDLDSIEVEPDDPLLQAQTSAAEALTDMETIKRVFNELSVDLRLDLDRTNLSWSAFEEVSTNYTLEGDPLHWLCCAIFLACRSAEEMRDTENESSASPRRSHLSIHRLLQSASSLQNKNDIRAVDSQIMTDTHQKTLSTGTTVSTAAGAVEDGSSLPPTTLTSSKQQPTLPKETIPIPSLKITQLSRSPSLFLSKLRRWMSMTKTTTDDRTLVDKLEKTYAVSRVVFEKFDHVFDQLFREESDGIGARDKSCTAASAMESAAETTVPSLRRETRTYGKRPRHDVNSSPEGSQTLTSSSGDVSGEDNLLNASGQEERPPPSLEDVKRYSWTLFIHVKSTFPTIASDLVNSYHLMLCVFDFIFHNLYLDRRRDIINPHFSSLPSIYQRPMTSYKPRLASPVSILEDLCEQFGGTAMEAKGVKFHYLMPFLHQMFEKMTLRGKSITYSQVLSAENFKFNNGVINTFHDDFVMSTGDFEERQYLNSFSDIGEKSVTKNEQSNSVKSTSSGSKSLSSRTNNEKAALPAKTTDRIDASDSPASSPHSFIPPTPLTNRHLLRDKSRLLPADADQQVARLKNLLVGSKVEPLPLTAEVLAKSQGTDPEVLSSIFTGRIKLLSEAFLSRLKYLTISEDHVSEVRSKCQLILAKALYYKTLEGILQAECKRLDKDASALGPMLEQDSFHRSLFACALQIVLFAYNSLSRRQPDHGSQSPTDFPFVTQVCDVQPYHFYRVIELVVRSEKGLTREVVKHLNSIEETVLESLAWKSDSPVWTALQQYVIDFPSNSSPSCEEVMSSKARARVKLERADTSNGSATGALEGGVNAEEDGRNDGEEEDMPAGSRKITIHVQSQQADQTVMVPVNAMMIPSDDGQSYSIRLAGNKKKATEGKQIKHHKALFLFFRKVYHMASLRLRDLCSRLDVGVQKMEQTWTLFEAVLRNDLSSIMRGRHLDQILICALYAIAKLGGRRGDGKPLPFQDLMRSYRMQPQYHSQVYRSVLLSATTSPEQCLSDNSQEKDSNLPSTSNERTGESRRGDLILFYNTHFIGVSKAHVACIVRDRNGTKLSQLPNVHPSNIPGAQFGRQLADQHSIFVSPRCNLNGCPPSTGNKLSYRFAKSPKRDLRAINIMIRRGEARLRAPSTALPVGGSISHLSSNGPTTSVSAANLTNVSTFSPSTMDAFKTNGAVDRLPAPMSLDADPRHPIATSNLCAIRNLDFEPHSTGVEVEFEEEEDDIEEDEDEEEEEEDEDYDEEIVKKRPKLMSSGKNPTTLQQLESLMKSLPEGDGDAQFEIVIDGPDGTESKVLRVNSAGEIIGAPTLDVPDVDPVVEASSSSPELQHFVTFDERGREIHFVAPASASSSLPTVSQEQMQRHNANRVTSVGTQNSVSSSQQVVQYVMAGGDNQNQIPEGGGFSTLVVGDDSMQSLAHVLDDNVTVFNEDGLVVDKVGSDGTFYQLITEDGSTIVTTGDS